MHERVEKLADRLEKLDGVDTPTEPAEDKGILATFTRTPVTTSLAVITLVLCAITFNSVVLNPQVTTDGGYVSRGEHGLTIDDQKIEPPLLRANHSTDRYIDYTLFVAKDDRDAARHIELTYFDAAGEEKSLRTGTCLTTGHGPVVVKNCRTQIPYGLKNGDYRLRATLDFSDSGKESIDSASFSLDTKQATTPDTTNLTAPISAMLADAWEVDKGHIRVDIAKTDENRNRINDSDSFVFKLLPVDGNPVKVESKSCNFLRIKPTHGLFRCKVGIPEKAEPGRYSIEATLFDGIKFNSAKTSYFEISKAHLAQ